MRVAVLGGRGFIGRHLAHRLTVEGHDVLVVDRQDLDLTSAVSASVAVYGCDWVFHLAADMGGVGYFHSDADFAAATTNGQITANVLRACAEHQTPRSFYASSACAYPVELQDRVGHPVKLPEDYVGRGTPDALYGAEKLHGLRLAAKVPGARVGILHTVYGPLQDYEGRRAKFPASVCRKAIEARETGTLELWGDGKQMRSYLYIDDAVERIMRVMAADEYEGPVNIGASGAESCMDVAKMALDLAGAQAKIVTNPAEPSGVMSRDCDNTQFDRRYGKGPDRGLRAGFAAMIEWMEGAMA